MISSTAVTDAGHHQAVSSNRAVHVRDLNEHIVCCICFGYLIDATTITECLHSFCRSCIVQYLDTSDSCPMCGLPVNSMNPLSCIRADRKLQELVYKLVPRLFVDEMKRRQVFYAAHPDDRPDDEYSNSRVDSAIDIVDRRRQQQSDITAVDRQISVSVRYLPMSRRHLGVPDKKKQHVGSSYRRFLLCPARLRIEHLQKFVMQKFDLSPKFKVNFFQSKRDVIPLDCDLTMLDVVVRTDWKMIKPLKLYFTVAFKRLPLSSSSRHESLLHPQSYDDTATVPRKRDHSGVSAATPLSRRQCHPVSLVSGRATSRKKEINCPRNNKNKPAVTGSIRGFDQSKCRGRRSTEYGGELQTVLKNDHLQLKGGDVQKLGRRRGRPRKHKSNVVDVTKEVDRVRQREAEDGSLLSERVTPMSSCSADEVDNEVRASSSQNMSRCNIVTSCDRGDVDADGRDAEVCDTGTSTSALPVVEHRSIWNVLPSLCADSSLPQRRSADSSTVDDDSSINNCHLESTSTRMTSSSSSSSSLRSSSVSSSSRQKPYSSPVQSELPQLNDSYFEEVLVDDVLQLAAPSSSFDENKLRRRSNSVDGVSTKSLVNAEDRKCRFKRDDNNNGDHVTLGVVGRFPSTSIAKIVKDEPDSVTTVDRKRPRPTNLGEICRASMSDPPQQASGSNRSVQSTVQNTTKTTAVTKLSSGMTVDGQPADEALCIKNEVNDVNLSNVSDISAQLYQLTSGSSPTVSHESKRDVTEHAPVKTRSYSSRPAGSLWRPITSTVERPPLTTAPSDGELTHSETVLVEAARHRNLPPVVMATSSLSSCWRHNGYNIGRLG